MTKKKPSKIKAKSLDEEAIMNWYYRNIDINNRVLYFGAWQPSEELIDEDRSYEVNDWSAQNIIKGLHVLESTSNDPVKVIWFSYGGDKDAGMAIYDKLIESNCDITMECYGRVRSMGTIILQAAVKRRISKNCSFMIHYGTLGMEPMHAKDAYYTVVEAERDNDIMEDIYLGKIREKRPGYLREELQDLMKHDKWMTPHEAVEIGLADEVI